MPGAMHVNGPKLSRQSGGSGRSPFESMWKLVSVKLRFSSLPHENAACLQLNNTLAKSRIFSL